MPDFPVPSFPPFDGPQTGDRVPDFIRPLVTEEHWADESLSTLADEAGRVLLFFYPMNWGGKAMYWWKEITERGWGSDELSVVGIGIGHPFDNQRFIEARDLPYPLFSDPANGVAERYDLVHDLDGMAGIEEPRPAVYLLDDDLVVEYCWIATEWPETPPYDEIETAIERR